MHFYFITIDKCKLDFPPKVIDYEVIINSMSIEHGLDRGSKHLECYEYKNKSEKYQNWIHYHGVFECYRTVKYTDIRFNGYSVKIKKINNLCDMRRIAAYINKEKIDKVDLHIIKPTNEISIKRQSIIDYMKSI